MKIGDKLKRKIKVYDPELGSREAEHNVEATVVYIHPQRRFITLRYDLPGGSFCESERLIQKK